MVVVAAATGIVVFTGRGWRLEEVEVVGEGEMLAVIWMRMRRRW